MSLVTVSRPVIHNPRGIGPGTIERGGIAASFPPDYAALRAHDWKRVHMEADVRRGVLPRRALTRYLKESARTEKAHA